MLAVLQNKLLFFILVYLCTTATFILDRNVYQ